MTAISLLQSTLKSHLPWHGARLNFLAQLLIPLFRVKTVNLAEIASAFMGQVQQDSHYKRRQGFLRHFELDYTLVAQVVVAWINFTSQWVLCLEQTQWQLGKTTPNVLLPQQGNSNTAEGIDLVALWLQLFAHKPIAYLSARVCWTRVDQVCAPTTCAVSPRYASK